MVGWTPSRNLPLLPEFRSGHHNVTAAKASNQHGRKPRAFRASTEAGQTEDGAMIYTSCLVLLRG